MLRRLEKRAAMLVCAAFVALASGGCVCLATGPEAAAACEEMLTYGDLFGNQDEDLSNQGAGGGGTGGGGTGGGGTGTPE